MNIEILDPKNCLGKLMQIAEIHALAYSLDHFTSNFSLTKLAEYNQMLIEASNICLVALEGGNVIGFLIAGENLSEAVKKFTTDNRVWLIFQLLKTPFILLAKILEIIQIKFYPSRQSKAKFRLLSVAVLPNFQNRGVGTKILDFFEQELSRRNINAFGLSVKSTNKDAINFYKRNGFIYENNYLGSIYYIKYLKNI
jgi:ribosomal protein S18 acetylase RimI-like enzyme